MKKKLKLGLVLLFVAITGVLAYQFLRTFQKIDAQSKAIENLPQFTLNDTQGNLRTQKDIDQGQWTVFVFFNSECHYCQEEAQQLKGLKDRIKSTHFIWVSAENKAAIVNFEKAYELDENANVFFLQDPNADFAKACNIVSTPQFLVYDSENKLRKNHKGAWRIDTLLEHITNDFKTP